MTSKFVAAAVFSAAAVLGCADAFGASKDLIKRGEYLAGLMACAECHSPRDKDGAPDLTRQLTGADVGFEMPGTGVFFPPNLTPDKETGLGDWSTDEIVTALRTGERPDGRLLAPVMPWPFYAEMTDKDAKALVAYLKSLPPVKNRVPGPFGPTESPTAPYLAIQLPENGGNKPKGS